MSDYYAGYHGSGLKLNEEEYIAFRKKYLEVMRYYRKNITEKDDFAETFDDTASECGYIRSAAAYRYISKKEFQESDPFDHFYITKILTDDCDGMQFDPYFHNGRPNLPTSDYVAYDLRGQNSYVAFSDFNLDDVQAFFGMPYKSYEEFVQEFKDKFQKYLPDDFDWDAHIGRFSYAAYA